MRVLGMYCFTGLKVDGLIGDPDPLFMPACQMHFDTVEIPIIKGKMFKSIDPEVGIQLAIDTNQ